MLIEEIGVDFPQRPIGSVIEGEFVVGIEDGDAREQLVESAPMGFYQQPALRLRLALLARLAPGDVRDLPPLRAYIREPQNRAGADRATGGPEVAAGFGG